MGGVVLGNETNDETTNRSHGDAEPRLPGVEVEVLVANRGLEGELWRKEVDGSVVDGRDHEDSSTDELNLEGLFDLILCLDGLNVGGNEGADQADKDTNGTRQ